MLKAVSVTYKAPPGDSKVVETLGHTFYDGKPETITVDEDTLARLQGNPHFKCGEVKDAPEPKSDPAQEKAAEAAALAADEAKAEAQQTHHRMQGDPLWDKRPDAEAKASKSEAAAPKKDDDDDHKRHR